MAMTYATITGQITRPGSNVGIRAKITATPLTTNAALKFVGDDRMTVGPETAETSSSGTLSTLKVPTNVDLAELYWRITAEALDKVPGVPAKWTIKNAVQIAGTGTVKLKDLVEIDVTAVNAQVIGNLTELVGDAEAAATTATAKATETEGWAEAAASSAADADLAADTATGAASSASTSAGTASTAASTATGAASTATGAASTATTKAGEASSSAAAASASATAAQTARDDAQTARTDAEAARDQAVEISGINDVEGAMDSLLPAKIGDSADPVGAALSASIEDVGGELFAPTSGSPHYAPRATLTDLPSPAYFAHRGGGGSAPEETMAALRSSAAIGAEAMEVDIVRLSDGAFALMHDTTVDRTTNGTGNATSYTSLSWQALNAADAFPWYGVEPPALLSQVLAEFGGQTVLMMELKDQANTSDLLDVLDARNLQGSVIIETSDIGMLPTIKARGYKCYFWWGIDPSTAQIAGAVANGADYLGCDHGLADAKISELVATGVPVIPFTVNRHKDRDRLLALGCAGMMSDYPGYIRRSTPMRTTDSWRQNSVGHGLIPFSSSLTFALSSGRLAITQTSGTGYALVGEVSPVANPAGTYSVEAEAGWLTLPASGSAAVGICVAAPDDRAYQNASGSYAPCYQAYLRQSGLMSLFRYDTPSSAPVSLGSVSTPALVAGTLAHIKVTVTPTDITVTRTDTANTIPAVNDTTYRGGHVHVGYTGSNQSAHFANLTVT